MEAHMTRKPDDWVRLAFFAGLSIVATLVVLIVLRRVFPGLNYPLTMVTPYAVSVASCGLIGFMVSAWRRGAGRAANLTASLVCFIVPAITLYVMMMVASRSLAPHFH